jgi:phosphoserine phosphatase
MADAKVNEAKEKSNFSDKDEERLLAEEDEQRQDCVTTGDTNNDSTMMWEAIKGLGKNFWRERQTHASLVPMIYRRGKYRAYSDQGRSVTFLTGGCNI